MMSTNAVRARFIDYFKANAHRFVASSSLVPAADPTLLFTNAGMVPFKDVFLGRDPRDCLLYTSPSPRDKRQSRMPSSA